MTRRERGLGHVRPLAAATFAALLNAANATARRRAVTSKRGPDHVEFRRLIDQYCASWSTLDPDQAAGLYAKDAGLIFYHLAPFAYRGWEDLRRGIRSLFFDKMSAAVFTHRDDLFVHRRGHLACTAVTLQLAIIRKDGRTARLRARQTAIWERRGERWWIVHEHLSAPMPTSRALGTRRGNDSRPV